MKQPSFLTLLAAATLTFTSCSSPTYEAIDEKTQGATYEKGVPGGTLVETYKLTATYIARDWKNFINSWPSNYVWQPTTYTPALCLIRKCSYPARSPLTRMCLIPS